ncbi:alpha/beta hydrolase [Aliiroseovarius sp. S2029]|nr:alpha/beta hydrolase [Aliiroseovarius sp. S2029]
MMTVTCSNQNVLILHGLGGTTETMRPLAHALDVHGFSAHTVTLAEADRARVKSGGALSHIGLNDLLAEARTKALHLAECAQDKPPIICGHSNGALLGLALAGEGLASHLVLLAPAPPPSIASGTPRWLQKLFFRLSLGRNWRTGIVRFDEPHRMDPDPPTDEIRQSLLPDSGRVLAEAMDLTPGNKFDPAPPLQCSCTVIAGGQDRIVPMKAARAIAERYSADFHLFQNGGHWFPAEAKYSEQIAEIIASHARVSD